MQVLEVKCALSGSMNYVTNETASGVPITDAMRYAYENRSVDGFGINISKSFPSTVISDFG